MYVIHLSFFVQRQVQRHQKVPALGEIRCLRDIIPGHCVLFGGNLSKNMHLVPSFLQEVFREKLL